MEMETINNLQDFALLNKGLSLLNNIHINNKNGNVTPLNETEIDAIEFCLQNLQIQYANNLKAITDTLK